jgi:hypothetical protein
MKKRLPVKDQYVEFSDFFRQLSLHRVHMNNTILAILGSVERFSLNRRTPLKAIKLAAGSAAIGESQPGCHHLTAFEAL